MSGHSKWSKIKRAKGVKDQKKGKIYSKVSREIMVAVRQGGEIPSNNFRLRLALDWAKAENMPAENVKRAITKAAGAEDRENYLELVYEGVGRSNVAIIVQCLSNNKQRTIAKLREIFNKAGGEIVPVNSLAHLFDNVGIITISKTALPEAELFELAINNGAFEIENEDDEYQLICERVDFNKLLSALQNASVEIAGSGLVYQPKTIIDIEDKDILRQSMDLVDALEEHDDVAHVFYNFEFADEPVES